MRTLVDIDDKALTALDQIARRQRVSRVSRASLIREAVSDLLAKKRRPEEQAAFGLWGEAGVDGLAYQKALREEW